jgi:transposase-like protein
MSDKFTVRQFNYRFPTEDACLEAIKQLRYGDMHRCPECGKPNKFYKVTGRKAYSCSFCRYQLYPLAGTIFEKSTTPLKDWMYAIYLMTQTRAGISAKQLERMLGCTYKTAWRMFHQIRKLMAEENGMLTGEIEVDEAYFHPNPERRSTAKPHKSQVVFGMVERGGRARVKHVKSSGVRVLQPEIVKNVGAAAVIYSDEHGSYRTLPRRGYQHQTITHSKRQYVAGRVHTQNVENLWSNMKRGIYGVYRHVDPSYLQAYANEYAFRYSHRALSGGQMFDALLTRSAR